MIVHDIARVPSAGKKCLADGEGRHASDAAPSSHEFSEGNVSASHRPGAGADPKLIVATNRFGAGRVVRAQVINLLET